MEHFRFVVEEDSEVIRLDVYLSETKLGITRSQLKQRVKNVIVNNTPAKLSSRLHPGNKIELDLLPVEPQKLVKEDIPLNIIYENDFCTVINKEQGMVVHPGAGNRSGTLANGLFFHTTGNAEFAEESENIRSGIVHRLDKDTSGVIITAKSIEAHEYLARQFAARSTKKIYYAVLKGTLPQKHGTVTGYITRHPKNRQKFMLSQKDGKYSETEFKVLKERHGLTFIRLIPRTGRTHQLRVHMAHLGAPILGDPIYSRKDSVLPNASLMLHAYSLEIKILPERETKRFRAPLPQRMKETIQSVLGQK